MIEQYEFNHYVVIEHEPPEAMLTVLQSWLSARSGQPLSERVWVYQARLGDENAHADRVALSQALRSVPLSDEQAPFRILFLAPNGMGAFGYRMPMIAMGYSSVFGSLGAGGEAGPRTEP